MQTGMVTGLLLGFLKKEEARGQESPDTLEDKLIPNTSGAWAVKREWTRSEISLYSRWFSNIFEKKVGGKTPQRAAKIPYMLKDPEMNLLLQAGFSRGNNDTRMFDDSALSIMNSANACGTFPILMHMYYCAVRGLPATFTKVSGDGGDIRYSRGNAPVRIIDPVTYGGGLKGLIRDVFFGESNYTTGNWRTSPDLEGTDTVPVAITLETTIPGLTLLYNTDGHGLAIGKATPSGDVRILDGHPDGSITSGQTLAALESVTSSVPEGNRESWYGGWRMRRLAKTVRDSSGHVIGVKPFTNLEMGAHGFSDEQYFDIIAIRKKKPVKINGKDSIISSFPEYAQKKLSTGGAADPHAMIHDWARQLQTLFSERALFVQQGWDDVLKSGPITLPDNKNIYQAEGRWEKWSSPSSDCDRKGGYFLTADRLDDIAQNYDPKDGMVAVAGFGRPVRTKRELALAIIEEQKKAFEEAKVTYKASSGRNVTLTLNEIEKRLFSMSFDPNHAPELRWGATIGSTEAPAFSGKQTPLASGGTLSVRESYDQEQGLRYRLTRKPGYTPLDGSDNPKGALKELLEDRLGKYLK